MSVIWAKTVDCRTSAVMTTALHESARRTRASVSGALHQGEGVGEGGGVRVVGARYPVTTRTISSAEKSTAGRIVMSLLSPPSWMYTCDTDPMGISGGYRPDW